MSSLFSELKRRNVFRVAIEWRDRGLNLILGDPMIDNLRDDPRFADALKRMNRTAVR